MFGNETRNREKLVRDSVRAIKHVIKHAERENMRALKHSLKYEWSCAAAGFGDMGYCENIGNSGARSVDAILNEVDCYISYMEDLPKERLAPYENKIDCMGEHLKKLKGSLNK